MLIAAKDLALGYSGVPAAWDITLDVQAGEGLALIGPNGSGKTTLLRAVLGDVRILSGALEVGASTIGYVPQNNDLDPTFPVSAREVVTMGLYGELGWGSRPGRAHRARVEEALERVGMAERASMRFGRLSGGQRQRILVARALVARPQLILMDEPFNGLDQPNRDSLVSIVRQATADGVGVVVSTHDLALAHLTCARACLLSGRQIAFGPVDEVLTQGLLARAYGAGSDALAGAAP